MKHPVLLRGLSMHPLVRIIIGSSSDEETCRPIQQYLSDFGIDSDFHISSAHRNPEKTKALVIEAEQAGIKLFIACAGMAAHLPGVIAALTCLPVIGVPLKGGSLSGEDALFSIVQMPPGVPVATVAINGVKNAAVLAAQILALGDNSIKQKLFEYKQKMAES